MIERRSRAQVQQDPIRTRLGKTQTARDVRCPNCGVVYGTSHRWQMICPECRHTWTDRSSRTFMDELRDRRLQVLGTLSMVIAAVIAVGTLGAFIVWVFVQATETWGWERTAGLAAFFIACLLSLPILGRIFQR